MNWKFNNKTGIMEPHETPQNVINKSIQRNGTDSQELKCIHTLRDGVKILTDGRAQYLAVCFQGQWRLLGVVTNMKNIMDMVRGPLVNFHDAWIKGTPIKIKQN